MWSRTPISWWLPLWLSWSLASAATVTAWRLHATLATRPRPAWRTPLLRLHAATLTLNPHAGLTRPRAWLRPHLQLVKRACEDK